MAKGYIMLYYDFVGQVEALTNAEIGRLVAAMIEYARDGAVTGVALTGNERILFPVMRAQIDRENAAYDARARQNAVNGKKGGRPKKAKETQNNPVGFPETEKGVSQNMG